MEGVLVKALEPDNEVVLDDGVDVDLIKHMIHLMIFDDFRFIKHFDGIMFPCLFILGHLDNSKPAFIGLNIPLPMILPTS